MSPQRINRFAEFTDDERETIAMGLVAAAFMAMEDNEDPINGDRAEDRRQAAKFLLTIVPLLGELLPQVAIPRSILDKLNEVAKGIAGE